MVLAQASPPSQALLVWEDMRVPYLALTLLMFQTLSRILVKAILHAVNLGTTVVRLATCWPRAMEIPPALDYAEGGMGMTPVPAEVVLSMEVAMATKNAKTHIS